MDGAPQVLVQGTADVDDRDLDANRRALHPRGAGEAARLEGPAAVRSRSSGCSASTSPASTSTCARSASTSGPSGDPTREPQLFDAHMEEVRSGHDEEPDAPHAGRRGRSRRSGTSAWTSSAGATRTACSRSSRRTASRSRVRVPISVDRRRAGCGSAATCSGVPVQPGLACVTVARPRSRLLVAAQLPGARRPRGGGRRLGARAAAAGRRPRAAAGVEAAALPDERAQDGALLAHGKKNETRT